MHLKHSKHVAEISDWHFTVESITSFDVYIYALFTKLFSFAYLLFEQLFFHYFYLHV
jgi:hypothetical protein